MTCKALDVVNEWFGKCKKSHSAHEHKWILTAADTSFALGAILLELEISHPEAYADAINELKRIEHNF